MLYSLQNSFSHRLHLIPIRIVSDTSYTVLLSQASQDLYVCCAVSSHVLERKTKAHAWVEKVRLPSGGP